MANLRVNNIFGESGKDSNGSALFNGTDYLTAANASAFRVNQGSGQDFTIEAWIYLKEAPSTNAQIASIYHTSGNQRSYMLYVSSSLELKFNYASSGTAGSVSTLNAGSVPTNEWVHVAITNDTSATTARLFKNGFLKDDDTGAHTTYYANTTGDFAIGQDFPAGFISNLHIVRGTCKYTGDFTPSKEPIEEDSNTTVLCLNSRLDVLNDDKSNTFTQTAAGGVKASSFIPFDRADSGNIFNGPISLNTQGYMYFPTGNTTDRGRGRGIINGGRDPALLTRIDYLEIQSQGNSIDFGDLTAATAVNATFASSTRGILAGGGGGGGTVGNSVNTIEFITIATTSNATDFGDLTDEKRYHAGLSNQVRGITAGGAGYPSPARTDIIDFVTIASEGNAQDFGNLSEVKFDLQGAASPTRGLFIAGANPGVMTRSNVVEYVTIATAGNAQDFGDLQHVKAGGAATSSNTRAIYAGGNEPSFTTFIEFLTIATTGGGTDFGDLTLARGYQASLSNNVRGLNAGGYASSTAQNTIDFVTIAQTGTAQDFGDLLSINYGTSGSSDSHGGLT